MKINYGVLFAGGAVGIAIGWYYMSKVQVPNAYALGQANPTLGFQNLTPAQLAQLNQQPTLPSPPPASTVAASAVSQLGTTGDSTHSIGQQAGQTTTGTGAIPGVYQFRAHHGIPGRIQRMRNIFPQNPYQGATDPSGGGGGDPSGQQGQGGGSSADSHPTDTGALLGRGRLMPIRYRGMGRHG